VDKTETSQEAVAHNLAVEYRKHYRLLNFNKLAFYKLLGLQQLLQLKVMIVVEEEMVIMEEDVRAAMVELLVAVQVTSIILSQEKAAQ
jgi:hypothetical protein